MSSTYFRLLILLIRTALIQLLTVVNQVGMPRLALPTLVSYLGSHAFRDHGPGLVWDTTTHRLEEPQTDERERAMGFPTGTTTAPELIES